MASAMDHRNDVLISAAVLLGVGASNLGIPVFDPLAAIAVGVWIIWAGFRIGRDNIKYLMGEAPAPEMVARVLAKAREVPACSASTRFQRTTWAPRWRSSCTSTWTAG